MFNLVKTRKNGVASNSGSWLGEGQAVEADPL